MKVYMSVDMEGVCGIVLRDQLIDTGRQYEEARHLLTMEVNAAVEGALAGGAEEIVVMDAHGGGWFGVNFLMEELHPAAKYYVGYPPINLRFPFLDDSFDLMFFIGSHAKAGTPEAVRDHSFTSTNTERIMVNGIEMGEIGVDALITGHFNVPVALVTGDDKACKEAKMLLGGIETAVVKFASARHGALNYAPSKAREIIRKAACDAVKRAGDFKPFKLEPPYTMEIDYLSTDVVDNIFVNGVDRIKAGPKKVIYKTDTVLELFGKPAF